jgi:MFS family permease
MLNRPYLLLGVANFCFMFSMALFVLLPHFLALRGTSEAFYGAVSGTVGLGSFLFAALLGHWGDRWDRKRAVRFYMLPGLAGSALAWAALGADPRWYFAVRALHGFSWGLAMPIVMAWAVEWSPPARRLEGLAYFGLTSLTAGALGPLAGELLLAAQAQPVGAGAYGAVFALGLGMTALGLAFVQTVPRRPAAEGAGGSAGGLMPLLRGRAAQLVLLVSLNFGGVSAVLMTFGKTYAEHLHLAYATVLFASFSTGAVASRLFIRPILARITQYHLVVIALVGVAASFVILVFTESYAGLGGAGLMYGISHGVLYPALSLRFLELFTPRELGRATTLFSSVFSLGTGLYPYVGGFIAEAWGFETMFALTGLVTLASLALHGLAEKAGRRP